MDRHHLRQCRTHRRSGPGGPAEPSRRVRAADGTRPPASCAGPPGAPATTSPSLPPRVCRCCGPSARPRSVTPSPSLTTGPWPASSTSCLAKPVWCDGDETAKTPMSGRGSWPPASAIAPAGPAIPSSTPTSSSPMLLSVPTDGGAPPTAASSTTGRRPEVLFTTRRCGPSSPLWASPGTCPAAAWAR